MSEVVKCVLHGGSKDTNVFIENFGPITLSVKSLIGESSVYDRLDQYARHMTWKGVAYVTNTNSTAKRSIVYLSLYSKFVPSSRGRITHNS